MVLGTFCRLIVPLLALPSMNGVHPIREPISSRVDLAAIRSAEAAASPRRHADLFRSEREIARNRSQVRQPGSGRFALHPGRGGSPA